MAQRLQRAHLRGGRLQAGPTLTSPLPLSVQRRTVGCAPSRANKPFNRFPTSVQSSSCAAQPPPSRSPNTATPAQQKQATVFEGDSMRWATLLAGLHAGVVSLLPRAAPCLADPPCRWQLWTEQRTRRGAPPSIPTPTPVAVEMSQSASVTEQPCVKRWRIAPDALHLRKAISAAVTASKGTPAVTESKSAPPLLCSASPRKQPLTASRTA